MIHSIHFSIHTGVIKQSNSMQFKPFVVATSFFYLQLFCDLEKFQRVNYSGINIEFPLELMTIFGIGFNGREKNITKIGPKKQLHLSILM